MVHYPLPRKPCGLQIKDALEIVPDLKTFQKEGTSRIDLGDPVALLLYNQAIFKDFLGLEFTIPSGYLIPTICNRWAFIEWILQDHPVNILEIGTGASAILALMFASMGCQVVATEVNKGAARSAQENIIRNSFQNKIHLHFVRDPQRIIQDLFSSIGQFDALVSNPPQYDKEYFSNHTQGKKGFIGQESELVGGSKGSEFLEKLLEEGSSYPTFPPIYFQLLNPKLFTEVENFLTANDYNYDKQKVSLGTRTRFFFRVSQKGGSKNLS